MGHITANGENRQQKGADPHRDTGAGNIKQPSMFLDILDN